MELIELSLALILAVALLGALAKRVPIPLPLLFILGGAALSFVPHLRNLTLDPEVFFLLFIPPLLFADGWLFNKREFLTYRYSILMLALGLGGCATSCLAGRGQCADGNDVQGRLRTARKSNERRARHQRSMPQSTARSHRRARLLTAERDAKPLAVSGSS
jgi:hypothetical protein